MKTIFPDSTQLLSYLLSLLLAVTTLPDAGILAQNQEPPSTQGSPSSSNTGQGAPMSEQELDSLVSPSAVRGKHVKLGVNDWMHME